MIEWIHALEKTFHSIARKLGTSEIFSKLSMKALLKVGKCI